MFTLKDHVGALAGALQVFQELGINVLHIELHSANETETVNVQGNEKFNSTPTQKKNINEKFSLIDVTFRCIISNQGGCFG